MPNKKKIKIGWWILRDGSDPMVHAVRNGNEAALCGWRLTDASHEVRGPKTIEKHRKCVRCTAQLGRLELMTA